MAALDFPNAPIVGEVYSANGVSYQWDGNFWQANNAGAAGGLPEAPIDGKSYGRKDTFWSEVVSIALHNSDKAAQATKDQTQDSLLSSHGTAIANISWTTLSGKPSTFPPSAHQHPISDVTTLQTTLDGKAPAIHTHAQTDITNLVQDLGLKAPLASPVFTGVPQGPTAAVGVANTQLATTAFVKSLGYATTVDLTAALALKENVIAAGNPAYFWAGDKTWKAVPAAGLPEAPLDGQQYARQSGAWTVVVATGGGGSVAWVDITGKPATFPPTVPIAWTDVSGKPATFPPTLPIAQTGVTNLVSDLALKAPLASPALTGTPTAPTPAAADSTTKIATTAFVAAGVTAGLAGKANVVHTHVIADVTNLQTTLDGKAPSIHTHVVTDVTGLQSQLDLKAPLASPVFTGNPTAPTPSLGDNDTSLATTAFVVGAIAAAPSGAVSVSETPPASPKDNTFWFDNGTGALALRYNDGNSSAYVQVNGAGINDAPRDGNQYMRQDGGWTVQAEVTGDFLPLTGGTLTGVVVQTAGSIQTQEPALGFYVYTAGGAVNSGYLSSVNGLYTNPSATNGNGGVTNGKGTGAGFLGYLPGGTYYGGLGYASHGFYSNYLCNATGYRGGDVYVSSTIQSVSGVGIFGGTNTTASSANCNITTGGGLYRSTASTRAVKRDIEPMWDEIADKILSLPTYWHRYAIQQKEPDYFSVYSLMAEDCAAADPRFANWDKAVVYDENGARVPKYEVQDVVNPDHAPWISQPEHARSGEEPPLFIKQEVQVGFELAEEDSPQHINWNALVTGLINIVQRQEARIAALEAANAPV